MSAPSWLSRATRAWVTGFLRRFDAMDRALVSAGWPATSTWWRAELERYLRSGRRRWVIRAGRRAGKSSFLCRLAVCWALHGPWKVPPGDTAVIAFVSVDRDEASGRLRTEADILRALGAAFEQRSDEIELTARRLVFRVVTSSIKGAVGFTSVMVVADEMARWESRDSAANPAPEVMGSLRPTMATQPLAFEVCSSSPWSLDDYHCQLFDDGDTDHQITSFAATWTANPTISEADTHALEPDERIWAREYAALPGVSVSAAFDAADVVASFNRKPSAQLADGFLAFDASSLRGDAFAFIAGRVTGAREIVVSEIDAWQDAQLRTVRMADIVTKLAERARAWGTRVVYGDQREEASLESMFEDHEIRFVSFAWTEQSKDDAVMFLRRAMLEERLCLCEHDILRRQLLGLKARLMPSGRVKYLTGGLDFASALITLAHAALDEDTGLMVERRPDPIVCPPPQLYHSPVSGGDFASQVFDRPRADGMFELDRFGRGRPEATQTTRALAEMLGHEVTRHFNPKG